MDVVLFVHLGTTTKIKSSSMTDDPMFFTFAIYYLVPHISRCTTTLCKPRRNRCYVIPYATICITTFKAAAGRKDLCSLRLFCRHRIMYYWNTLTSVKLRFANTVFNKKSAGICYAELYFNLCTTTYIKMQQQTARAHVLPLFFAGIC